FSISKSMLPVIVTNIKDSPRARAFTLLHEFTHVMLRQAGMCNQLSIESNRPEDEQRIETFCNWTAGAALIPRQQLLAESLVHDNPGKREWPDDQIEYLASRYGTSRE